MEEKINMIITMLETEKTLLELKKEKNKGEIWKCELLINYYMRVMQDMLTESNKLKNDLDEYNSIISLLEKIPSKWLEKIELFISENNYIEKAIDAEEEISQIEKNVNDIKQIIIKKKKRKKHLLDKNENIEKKLIFIDEKLSQPIDMLDENSIKKELSHKKKKHK